MSPRSCSDVYWEATSLDAGKVGKTGGQEKFGRIALIDDPNRGTRMIDAWFDLPPGRMTDSGRSPRRGFPGSCSIMISATSTPISSETRPEKEFLFAFALIWPKVEGFLQPHGDFARAASRDRTPRRQAIARRFDLDFLYGREGTGTLWTDPATVAHRRG